MIKLFHHIVFCIAAFTWLAPSPVQASHESPLYQAACQYRDAVLDFERAVFRSDYMGREQRRLADSLEDASSELRSAARRPDRPERLLAAWQKIQYLQSQVETLIFQNPRCPSRVDLLPCWERVMCAQTTFAEQMARVPCLVPGFPGVARAPVIPRGGISPLPPPPYRYRPRVEPRYTPPAQPSDWNFYRREPMNWQTAPRLEPYGCSQPSWDQPAYSRDRASRLLSPTWH